MGVLSDALPKSASHSQTEPTIQSDRGFYEAQFIGMTNPFKWVSGYKTDKCRNCKGSGKNKAGTEACYLCEGTGEKRETHVKLQYRLKNGIVEEEEMNFFIVPPRTSSDGKPLSPSTLFVRLRSLSGIKAKPEDMPSLLDEWYTGLSRPINVPCTIVIEDNKTGSALKITNVMSREVGNKAAPPPPPQDEPPFIDNGDPEEVPF